MTKITQAFIFAAGRGERMRPITDEIPKPLIEVKGRSIIDYSLQKLEKLAQIDKIIVNGFYLADKIEEFVKAKNNPKIAFSKEESKLETGGGLLFALKNQKFDENKPILLINGDIFWLENEDFSEILNLEEEFNRQKCDILLGLTKTKDYFGYYGKGDFNLSENGEINSVKSEGQLSHTFAGIQIINPKILQKAPAPYFSMNYFFQNSQKLEIDIKGAELKSKFFHIGDIKALEDVEDEMK